MEIVFEISQLLISLFLWFIGTLFICVLIIGGKITYESDGLIAKIKKFKGNKR